MKKVDITVTKWILSHVLVFSICVILALGQQVKLSGGALDSHFKASGL